ncbi:MAG: hypothetical protein ACI39W_06310 [Brotaphodocola sp.]
MNKKNSSGSGVFLMEMIMVVGFFLICTSVCMLAFAKANYLSQLAQDRNQAVLKAESMAEIWKLKGMDGLERDLEDPSSELQTKMLVVLDENGLETATITITRRTAQEVLFILKTSRYVPHEDPGGRNNGRS